MFDAHENLTKRANEILDEMRKRAKFINNQSEEASNIRIDEDLLYIPKQFQGNS